MLDNCVAQDLLMFTEADIKKLGVKNSAHRARVVSSLVALRTKYEKGKRKFTDAVRVTSGSLSLFPKNNYS
jgi:hypothetical protein